MNMNDSGTEDFNPDEFLQQALDANIETKLVLLPKGDYRAQNIASVGNARRIKPEGKPAFASVDIVFNLEQDARTADLGRDPLTVRYQLNLDLDPQTGKIAAGTNKNLRLGRLLDAAGVKAPWSFDMLVGRGPFMVTVGHEEDRRDLELPPDQRRVYERIDRVAKVS